MKVLNMIFILGLRGVTNSYFNYKKTKFVCPFENLRKHIFKDLANSTNLHLYYIGMPEKHFNHAF